MKIIKYLIIYIFFTTSLFANECYFKSETISENGIIKFVKEIKICEEVTKIENNSLWYNLAYTKEGNQIFWDTLVFIFTITK